MERELLKLECLRLADKGSIKPEQTAEELVEAAKKFLEFATMDGDKKGGEQ